MSYLNCQDKTGILLCVELRRLYNACNPMGIYALSYCYAQLKNCNQKLTHLTHNQRTIITNGKAMNTYVIPVAIQKTKLSFGILCHCFLISSLYGLWPLPLIVVIVFIFIFIFYFPADLVDVGYAAVNKDAQNNP